MIWYNGMFQQMYLQENVIGLCGLHAFSTFQTTRTKGQMCDSTSFTIYGAVDLNFCIYKTSVGDTRF